MASTLVPSINVRSEDDLAALVSPGHCEYGLEEGGRAEHMPLHGDIIQVIEDAHAKRIDRAGNGLIGVSRGWEDDCAALYKELRPRS